MTYRKTRKIWLMLMVACGLAWGQDNQPAKPAEAAPAATEKVAAQAEPKVEDAKPAEAKAEDAKPAEAKPAEEAPAQPEVKKLEGPLDDVPLNQLFVSQIRRLPDVNFANVETLQWSADGKRLIVDRYRNQAYQVAVVQIPSNLNEKRFPEQIITDTSRRTMLLHHGSPAWYPQNNRYAAYVSQMVLCRDYKQTIPINGQNCNLMFADLERRPVQTLELTTLPYSARNPQGVTAPCFSPNGKKLAWCGSNGKVPDRSIWGSRSLYIADFSLERGFPKIKNQREIKNALNGDYFNCFGISADNKLLYATNTVKNAPWYTADLVIMDLKTNEAHNLTNAPRCWDNFASFSPSGQKILWSSSIGQTIVNLGGKGENWQKELASELYIMEVKDYGDVKKRFTEFNSRDSRDNRTLGLTTYEHCYVGCSSWNPKFNQIAVVVYRRNTSSVYLLELISNYIPE